MKIWPTWKGELHKVSDKKYSVYFGSCSHNTAYQMVIRFHYWRYFIVLRKG